MAKTPAPKGSKTPPPRKRRSVKPLKRETLPPGRPSIFSPELAETLCLRVAEGRPIQNVCDDNDMPSRSTVYRWLVSDKHPGFWDMLARARGVQDLTFGDQMRVWALDLMKPNSNTDPVRAREAGNLIDKAARLTNDRAEKRVTLQGPGGGPVQHMQHADMTGWSPEKIERYLEQLRAVEAIAASD